MPVEKSYLEQLNELMDAVKSDSGMPQTVKKRVERIAGELFQLLWPYSA